MRWSYVAIGFVVSGLLINLGIKYKSIFQSSEALHQECARLTAHPSENLQGIAGLPADKISIEDARTACQQAFDRDGSPRSAFGLARVLFVDKKYQESIKYFEVALKAGYQPGLQYNGLANSWYGDGKVPENHVRAIEFGKKAIDAGFVPAAYTVGFVQSVIGSPAFDFDSSVGYLETATTAPLSARGAYSRLVEMFSEDTFKRRDLTRAKQYALAWLAMDDPYALYVLGQIYASDGFSEADPSKSFKFFKGAAERKVERSYVEMGRAYYYGKGIAKDMVQALNWFKLAAADNDPWANYVVGHMYYSGHGADKNAAESERYTNLAIKLGSVDAKNFYDETLGPLVSALRNMPKGDAQRCLKGQRSGYDRTIFEIHSDCDTPLNVQVCKNYALTDIISIFTEKNATSCDVRTVRGKKFIDSIYLASDDDALGWQLISGSRIQWSACYYPLLPKRVGSNQIRCEW